MDKILAFSILSSSPAEIARAGYATRLSWRSVGGKQAMEKKQQEDKVELSPRPERKREAKLGTVCARVRRAQVLRVHNILLSGSPAVSWKLFSFFTYTCALFQKKKDLHICCPVPTDEET
ncbi:hypothetical protein ACQJBY_062276 [Aegilops geniculata]